MASSTKADLLKIADDARNYEKAADAAIAHVMGPDALKSLINTAVSNKFRKGLGMKLRKSLRSSFDSIQV